MREIEFETAPMALVEHLESQLGSAMQIIAALVLTPAEAKEMASSSEGCSPSWVKDMRSEILGKYWHGELLQALRKSGFLTNTHPGFCVSPLANAPLFGYSLASVYADLETELKAFSEGSGEDLVDDDKYEDHWVKFLIGKGHSEEDSRWVMSDGGGSPLACEAAMVRLLSRSRSRSAKQ